MKNIIILIAFLTLFLLGGEAVKGQSFEREGVEYVLPLSLEECDGSENVFQAASERFHSSMILCDAQSMARQLKVRSERMIRLSVIQSKWASKALMRNAVLCKDELTHHVSQQFTSIRRQFWTVMSEYYVFGIRHILI